jgi:hypothetical protein
MLCSCIRSANTLVAVWPEDGSRPTSLDLVASCCGVCHAGAAMSHSYCTYGINASLYVSILPRLIRGSCREMSFTLLPSLELVDIGEAATGGRLRKNIYSKHVSVVMVSLGVWMVRTGR